MLSRTKRTGGAIFASLILGLIVGLAATATDADAQRWKERIVIGWTPPDITGVFKTATDFFEAAAEDANNNGFDVQIISRSPATHVAFADQVAIIGSHQARREERKRARHPYNHSEPARTDRRYRSGVLYRLR